MPRSCPTLISGCRFGIPVSECFRHILQSCLKPSLGGELKKSILRRAQVSVHDRTVVGQRVYLTAVAVEIRTGHADERRQREQTGQIPRLRPLVTHFAHNFWQFWAR